MESAAQRSGLQVYVILVSSSLSLRDNTTCSLVRSGLAIKFYTIDLETAGRGTPLGNQATVVLPQSFLIDNVEASFFSSPKLASSEFSAVHRADALRLLLVYKFGGFYLDLDYVVLNSLAHYNNIVVGNKPWDQLRGRLPFNS